MPDTSTHLAWPVEGLTRVPYWLYDREDVYAAERRRIFMGPSWHFLCLEVELPEPGDYRASFVGDVPVIVARDLDGTIGAFENRCAHRGALLCLKPSGHGREIACVYHNWTYDLKGRLTGVTFERGIARKGGMPASFRREDHDIRALRVETFAGLAFGSFAGAAPPLADYLGEEIGRLIKRVMKKPIRVLGRDHQVLPNNWKLYCENVRDPYHASLLHAFFTTFRLNRLSMQGGIIVAAGGGNHVSYSKMTTDRHGTEYDRTALRARQDGYRLADPSMIEGVDEFGDGVTLQILSVFPGFVLHQIRNSLAVRQVLPKGIAETELVWTYFGYADDDEAMTRLRVKQANLVGSGGYVSMEDGAVGGFIQRALAGAADDASVVEMGGHEVGSQDTRATETSVRGFWQAWRAQMGL